MTSSFLFVFLSLLHVTITSATANSLFVSISGLSTPTQVIHDVNTGLLFISEKGGAIKAVSNAFKSSTLELPMPAFLLSSISVDTDGQHGLTSIAVNGSFLYVLYHAVNNTDPTCISNGVIPQGGTAKDVLGCVTRVILSRFPIAVNISSPVGYALGSEFLLLNSAATSAISNMTMLPSHCSQFGFSGANHIIFNSTNNLLISVGVGANEDGPEEDVGQYGLDPCGQSNQVNSSGFLRAQSNSSLMGKIISLSSFVIDAFVQNQTPLPLLSSVAIVATGLRNPWRMAWTKSQKLYVIDPGLENYEELNEVLSSAINFGFPCVQGNVIIPSFLKYDLCKSSSNVSFSPSSLLYDHPTGRGTLSALAYDSIRSRFILADYANAIVFSIPANFSQSFSTLPSPLTSAAAFSAGVIIEALPAFASHIESVQVGEGGEEASTTHLLVDVVKGTIKSKNLWGTPSPSSTATPSPSVKPSVVASGSTREMFNVMLMAIVCISLSNAALL
jgi:hypothetical protein